MKKGRKTRTGQVVSNKMQKTIVVMVTRRVKHPVLGKYFTKRLKYKVHDEKNESQIGDKVLITETKPISREKTWALVQILVKAGEV